MATGTQMIGLLVAAAIAVPAHSASAQTAPASHEAVFVPLTKAERTYAPLGPVGPYYPQVAVEARMSGDAVLECQAGASGALTKCKVVSETPSRYNFGVAARVMAQRIAAPAVQPGETIRVHVPFALGAPATIAP